MKKNIIKTGALAILLIAPVFVFLFLKFFGQNRFDLPYYFPELNQHGEVVKNGTDTVFHKIPAFSLENQNGEKWGTAQLKDKIVVVDFFFTRCGTICPKMTTQLTRVQKIFKNDDDVVLVSISIDPKHDSSSVLKAYSEKYDVIEGKWYFLTGNKKEIYDLAIKGFKLPVADASEYDSTIKSVDETFIHSEKLLLIDKSGFVRGIYDGTDNEDVDRLMLEIKILRDVYKK